MGYSIDDVNRMTIWEYSCTQQGWANAHGIKEKVLPPTDAEFEFAVANSRI